MPGRPYGSSKYGSGLYGLQGGTNPPAVVTNFTISNIRGSNGTQLLLTWTNPTTADFQGVRIIRRTDHFATSYADYIGGNYFDLNDPISTYTDYNLTNLTYYYYSIFTHDEVYNYSTIPATYLIQTVYLPEVSKFIDDKVTNVQAIVDKERVVFYWDNLSRTLNFKALTVASNNVGLTTTINSVDSSNPQTIFYADSSGLSTVNDKYKGEQLVFLDSFNKISLPKTITSYTASTNKFIIDTIEYPIFAKQSFGLSYIENVVDDSNLYIGGNLIYDTSVHKITGFNTVTKTFTVDTSNPVTLQAGNAFSVPIAHFPKLYVSKDRGITFDDGTDLIYTVTNNSPANFLGEGYFYNSIICNNTSILNITDPNFYIGAYITFLTGKNKGYNKKIKSFNRNTREFITDYFAYPIMQDEIFTINTYSLPLIRINSDYLFKIVLWNYNNSLPLYGYDVLISPSLSFNRYLATLDNGYWDINLNTDLYKLLQGIIKEAHSKAEIEADLQRKDFSITEVRNNKLFTNFGHYFNYEKPNSQQSIRYRRSLQDLITACRNTSTFEGLYNVIRAFYRITPVVTYLSDTGWRCGRERLGYERTIMDAFVSVMDTSADTSNPSIIIDSSSTGLNTNLSYYAGDYLAVTDMPAASNFNQALLGQIIPIVDSSATGSTVRFTVNPISMPVPAGATLKVFDVNYNVNYNTIPYSELANLFGITIQIYGPFLSTEIKTLVETLASKVLPLHVRKSFHYNTNFVGESSFGTFAGDSIGLKVAFETNTIVPDKDTFDELSENKDSITATVATVVDNYSKFTITNGTHKHNYYKNKKILFTTGLNAGIVRRVIEYIGGNAQIVTESFPYVISAGDILELESITYLTKYKTIRFDLTPDELDVNLITNSYFTTWFTRKTNLDLKEKVFIEFSDGISEFSPKRQIIQGELLNSSINCMVVPSLCSSYPETTNDANSNLYSGSLIGAGQSFIGDGFTLYKAEFFLKKTGIPTGTAVAKIYTHSGTYGTSSKPTGSALAVSDTFDVNTLTTTSSISTFTFNGANKIILANGTNYTLTIEYSGGDVSNYLMVGNDASSPTHDGNYATKTGSTWTATANKDLNFYIYTSATTTTLTASGIDAELFNIDSYYKNAYIEFTSGINIGEYRKVDSYVGQTKSFIIVADPLDPLIAPAIDDTFRVIISDMRRYAKMSIYHNNLTNVADFEIESLTINIL